MVGQEGRSNAARAPRWLQIAPVVVIVVVCVVATWFHVDEHRRIGPLDEQAHLDVVNRILDGEWPVVGDKLTRTTREQAACRGLEAPIGAGQRADCDPARPLARAPEQGNSYEAGQPPVYYVVTAVVSRVAPGDDVDSVRVVGGLWLAAGAVGLYLALRRVGTARWFAVVVCLALALTPPIWFTASVVSNDVAVWAFGGFAVWFAVRLMQAPELRARHAVAAAGVGVLGGLVKPTALLIVAALAVAVVLQQTRAGRARTGWYVAASLVVGAAAATGLWGLVVTSVSDTRLADIQPWKRFHVDSLDVEQLVRQPLFNLVSPYEAYVSHTLRADWILSWLFQAATYVGVGLLLLPVLARWPEDPGRSIGVSYAVAVLISGPYYVLLYYVSTHIEYGASPRFGFGLVPMAGVMLATWVPRAWQRWAIVGILLLPVVWYALLLGGAVTVSPR